MAPNVTNILKALVEQGHSAFVVGGCVRDVILGLEPKDFDVCTSATPAEVLEVFPAGTFVDPNQAFPVVLVDGIEVATLRTEVATSRHEVEVAFTTSLVEDSSRRDLTINALYQDVEGNVLDPQNGLEDMRNGVIRFVGNAQKRIQEDPIRVLRAIRFAARFGFQLDAVACSAIKHSANDTIPGERISQELSKMLVHENRAEAVRLLEKTGLLGRFLPEVQALRGVEQNQHHLEGCALEHTLLVLENLQNPTPVLALAALLHDTGKAETQAPSENGFSFHGHEKVSALHAEAVCQRLRLSKKDTEAVVWLCRNHMRFHRVLEMRRGKVANLFRHPLAQEFLALGKADSLGKLPVCNSWIEIFEAFRTFSQEDVTLRSLGINGQTVMQALSLQPGPKVGQVLRRLEAVLAENPGMSKAELLTCL